MNTSTSPTKYERVKASITRQGSVVPLGGVLVPANPLKHVQVTRLKAISVFEGVGACPWCEVSAWNHRRPSWSRGESENRYVLCDGSVVEHPFRKGP